ncbi:MAG: T9SS type A sorting domain-containing protein [bacterium]
MKGPYIKTAKFFFLIAFLLALAGLEQAKAQEPLPDTVWTYTSWPSQNFTHVLFSKDGSKIYTGGNFLRVWDTETGDSILSINHGLIAHLALSQSGKYLASILVNGRVVVWDTETFEQFQIFDDITGLGGVEVVMSSDEELIAASSTKGVKIWNMKTKVLLKSFYNEMYPENFKNSHMDFSSDKKYLAMSDANDILSIYDIENDKFITSGSIESQLSVKFLLDSRYIIVNQGEYNKRKLVLLDIQNNFSKIKEFIGHTDGDIKDLKITPDGKYLISAGDDYTVRIWDIETGENTYTYYNNWGPKLSVDFSSDNKYIITCTSGSLHLNNAKWTGTGVENPNNPIEFISNISSFPNPGNDSITLEYTVNQLINLKIDVFDLTGNKIQNLFDGFKEPGIYNIDMDTGSIASGIYHIRFSAGEFISTIDIVVIK